MRNEWEQSQKTDSYNNTCATRQSAAGLLKDRAEMMRREALRLHESATHLDELSRIAANVGPAAEQALYQLAIESIRSNQTTRVF